MSNPSNAFFGKDVLSDVPFYIQYNDDWYEYYTYCNSDGTFVNLIGSQLDIYITTPTGVVNISSGGSTPYITLYGAMEFNILFDVPNSFIKTNFQLGKVYPVYMQLTDTLSKKQTIFKGNFIPS